MKANVSMQTHAMKLTVLALLIIFSKVAIGHGLSVYDMRCNNLENPLGVGATSPRFAWKLASRLDSTFQTAYEVRVFENDVRSRSVDRMKLVWNSGRKNSENSIQVCYDGTKLISNQKYFWQVRVWDNHGNVSKWSEYAHFHVGLLRPQDWSASWIEPGYREADVNDPCPMFRRDFSIGGEVKAATIYVTAHGMYEASINGIKVGEDCFTPGWTSYSSRLQYQAYDVTTLLKRGDNVLGALVGNGWYRGVLGWYNEGRLYGNDLALLLQLEITYSNGDVVSIGTDGRWKCFPSKVRYSQIYHGETIDARSNEDGWNLSGYSDTDWHNVKVVDHPKDILIETVNEPVREQEIFKPLAIFTTPGGDQVIDFGQNLVGWVKMRVKGSPGDTIVLTHAEVLDRNGNFYTENLRVAKAQNTYVLKGGEWEVFHPYFTWQGFRYVKVEGYPSELTKENFEAVALYSDMRPSLAFETSDSLINQLQHNIAWGQRGNFLDVPTDCPQRDERLGWTGDAQAFVSTAAFNMEVNNFFVKWMRDLEADQIDGKVPHVVPNILGPELNSAGWADAATIVPWNIYLAYGNMDILRAQYESMKAYVGSVRSIAQDDLWNSGYHFGDWLFYRPFDDNDGRGAVTDKYLIAQCFYAHSIQLLINTATLIGDASVAEEYKEILARVKLAFNREYVTGSGRLVSGTQTAYVLALHFDMLPEGHRIQAARRLTENIESYGHLTTGFLGTPYLCHVLSRFGYWDLAYSLLMRTDYPSWLYPVTKGATTIWERWDGIKPDGTFQTATMNSFNHYAYGAIGDWMYQHVAGIQRTGDVPAYRKITISPKPGGGLNFVRASLESPYGKISSFWQIEDGNMEMHIEVPTNTDAEIIFPPNADLARVKMFDKSVVVSNTRINVGSGRYVFTFPMKEIKVSE